MPTALGIIFTTLYNIVNIYYTSMLSTNTQTKLTIAFTVFFILFITINISLSSTINTLIGNTLSKRSAQESIVAAQKLTYNIAISVLNITLS